MARSVALLLAALCVVLPFLANARVDNKPFLVTGRVYCDTCRVGYETDAIKPIEGARVKIVCKDRGSLREKYSVKGVTNSTGEYNILVTVDHEDDICECKLLSSPLPDCSEPDSNRNSAPIILTRNNGMCTDVRHANSMGFLISQAMSGCTQILKKYEEYDI